MVAFRNLYKYRAYSIINIAGLAMGMAAFILIIQFVRFELSYDNFHSGADRIYRVQQDRYNKGVVTTQWAAGCSAVGLALYENFPEVENFTRFQKISGVMSHGDKKFREEEIYTADTSFFRIFSFDLIKGDPATILKNAMEMVVSESTARKYFGDEDPIGKSLRFNGGPELMITGIFRDVPVNSHLSPDILVSWATMVNFRGPDINTAWQWDGFFNYILLKPSTDPTAFEAKIPGFIDSEIGEEMARYNAGVVFHLQPLRSIHLHSDFMFEAEPNGNAGSVFALLIIAIFLVVIAWVNYINLSTSRSIERAREVGLRKVTGAARRQLIGQFLMESLLVNLLAMLLALLLVRLLNHPFNRLTGIYLDYGFAAHPIFWAVTLTAFIGGSALAGIYPALFLSSFSPLTAFRGPENIRTGGLGLRRFLVIFQFTASLVLIAGTLAVFRQISFMHHFDLGVDIDNTLVLRGPSVNDSTYSEKFSAFKEDLRRHPEIEGITASTAVPGRQPPWNAGGIRLLSQGNREENQYRIIGFDFDFVDFYGLNILEGRNFSRDFGLNRSTVLFNENAVRLIGFKDPADVINQKIFFWGDTFSVVGVVGNYHQEGPNVAEEPLIFRFFEDANTFYSIKVNPVQYQEALYLVRNQWSKFFPRNPFEYFWLDDYYNQQYKNEVQFGKVGGLFSILAIIIACLGLSGLSSYTTVRRTKEIGVRKVLGSTVLNSVLLLLRYFIIQVLIAVPIGLGLAWFYMSKWLQNFASRTSLGWWFFVIPVLTILIIAVATVGAQVARTATVNPSDSLRYE